MEYKNTKFAAKLDYQKGLHQFCANDLKGALQSFKSAMENQPDESLLPAIKSYLGYTLAAVEGKDSVGVQLMREALNQDFSRPDHFINLGRFYLNIQLNRKNAMQVFLKGLQFCPNNTDLQRMIRKMGVRKKPPIRFLSRRNLLNRFLGSVLQGGKKRTRPPQKLAV